MRRTHLLREKGQVASPIAAEPATPSPRIAVLRIGAAGGLVGMLCCVGPTLLALLVSAVRQKRPGVVRSKPAT